YIEKDSSINEEIERLRLAATSALLSRRDTIVVASVSCIYGITSPDDYLQMLLTVKRGQQISREAVLGRLIDMLYERNDVNFARGRFRVRGDVVEVYPGSADEEAIRIEFFGDEIDAIRRFDPLTGHAHESLNVMTFFPAKQFVTPADKLNRALRTIRDELEQRIIELESQNKLLEAQRLRIGEQELVPFVLPGGKRRTPNAQRPTFNSEAAISRTDEPPEQFDAHTPGAPLIVEQIIRPTGLLDPKITLKPLKNQIDETIELCRQRVEKSERILVTTLTKRTAEDLADYLRDVGLKVRYLHSDIDAIERVEILRGLRA